MPQWDFLDFLADHGRALSALSSAHARRGHRPDRGGRPRRRRARDDARRRARPSARRLSSAPTAAPRWCASAPASRSRTSARRWTCSGCGCRAGESDGGEALGRIAAGKMMVMLDRGDYWQCAYVIPKGAAEEIKAQGHRGVSCRRSSRSRPQMHDRVQELRSFDDVKLLTVKVDRLRAVAPAGAACASATRRMRCRRSAASASTSRSRTRWRRRTAWRRRCAADASSDDDLAAVQRRRMFPTRMTQRIQVFMQNNVLSRRAGQPHHAGAAVAGAAASAAARCCNASRRGWSGSASVPNMCWFHRANCPAPRA